VYDSTHPDRLINYDHNPISYDSMDYPIYYKGKNYSWTKGKLTRIYRGDVTQSNSVLENSNFIYNAYGQRTVKTYTYDPVPGVIIDNSYIYDTRYDYDHSGRLIREHCTERDNVGNITTRELIYLYDESSMIGVMYNYNGQGAESYYYHRNLQGDVIAIYNANGGRVVEYAYDAFGNCTIVYAANADLANANPIRYRGYYYDRETGLYYLNARYYSPEWRRFISPDDTAYLDIETPNGLNLYVYCANDPVNYVDPSGHSILVGMLVGAIIGAVIGGAYGGITAAANGQNVTAGILIGGLAGGLMGAGAALASVFLAPAITGGAVVMGGIQFSTGAAVAIGGGIAFFSGAFGGALADALTQIVNDGAVHNGKSVILSGVQWGIINVASGFLGSLAGPVAILESAILSGIFGSVTSAVGMMIDLLRSTYEQKVEVDFAKPRYMYA